MWAEIYFPLSSTKHQEISASIQNLSGGTIGETNACSIRPNFRIRGLVFSGLAGPPVVAGAGSREALYRGSYM